MSVWEFNACVRGFRAAHEMPAKKKSAPMSAEQLKNMGVEGF